MRTIQLSLFSFLASLLFVCCTAPISRELEQGSHLPVDGTEQTFTAVIEQGTPSTKSILSDEPSTKTRLGDEYNDERAVLWDADDQIQIGEAVYTVSQLLDGNQSATFSGSGATKDGSVYKAYYPAGIRKKEKGDAIVTLPEVQVYGGVDSENRPVIKNLPMYAESETTDLDFKNLCGILCLRIKADPISAEWAANQYDELETITKIEVTCGGLETGLSGDFNVTMDGNGIPHLSPSATWPTVTLDCSGEPGGGVQLSTTEFKEFCIAVPPGVFGGGVYDPDLFAQDVADPFFFRLYRKAYTDKGEPAGDIPFVSIPLRKAQFLVERSHYYTSELTIMEDAMTLVLTVSSDYQNSEITIPFGGDCSRYRNYPAALLINWDVNGAASYTSSYPGGPVGVSDHSHRYNATGDFKVRITARSEGRAYHIPEIEPFHAPSDFDNCLKAVTSPLLRIDYNSQPLNYYYTFYQLPNLISIHKDLFIKNGHFGYYDNLMAEEGISFDGCKKLVGWGWDIGMSEVPNKGIPSDLLKPLEYIRSLYGCFRNTGFSGPIPPGLLSENKNLMHVHHLFAESKVSGTIPGELFANCPLIDLFNSAFFNTNVSGDIPAGLFANNRKARDFGSVFASEGYGKLTSIPSGLFANNLLAEDFSSAFSGQVLLTGEIPSGLFENNMMAVRFDLCFKECYKLKIRPDIFIGNNQTAASRFSQVQQTVWFNDAFSSTGSSLSVSGEAPDLWNYVFANGVLSAGCFYGAKVSNSQAIPPGWK